MSQTQAQTDSLDGRDSGNEDKKQKIKSRRPANTAFRQQRLKAWQPILTPKTVLPLFFIIGIIFGPIGALLLFASAKVQEISIDYTNCAQEAPFTKNASLGADYKPIDPKYYSLKFKTKTETGGLPTWARSNATITYMNGFPTEDQTVSGGVNVTTMICDLRFKIPEPIGPSVLFYYRLTNFYQNHRRYVKSLDTDQLLGKNVSKHIIDGSTCDPLTSDDTLPYYPCGLIANSIFNDTFIPPKNVGLGLESIKTTNKGIAWASDASLYGKTSYKPSDIAVPPNWYERWGEKGYTEENGPPDLKTYEEFQVWMRTAGLPTFSKLAYRLDDAQMSGPAQYQIDVHLNYPVTDYGGTKSIVISTATVMGGKNPFLGIAYVVVGGLCILLGVMFSVANLIKPRKLGDHTYLTWNNDNPSTATTTGVSRPNDAA